MGRFADPNSGTSSFSILLGDAPHLDMQVRNDACRAGQNAKALPHHPACVLLHWMSGFRGGQPPSSRQRILQLNCDVGRIPPRPHPSTPFSARSHPASRHSASWRRSRPERKASLSCQRCDTPKGSMGRPGASAAAFVAPRALQRAAEGPMVRARPRGAPAPPTGADHDSVKLLVHPGRAHDAGGARCSRRRRRGRGRWCSGGGPCWRRREQCRWGLQRQLALLRGGEVCYAAGACGLLASGARCMRGWPSRAYMAPC